MPPKKKKSLASPVVVGTVSTRSTRRQSVVNIDIPKTRSKSGLKDSKLERNDSGSISATKFANQIRNSYTRVLKNTLPETRSILSQEKSINDASENQSEKHCPSSPAESSSMNISEECPSTNPENNENLENEAVREILEDWTDDDTQDSKRIPSEIDSNSGSTSETDRDKYFENLEFGADDIDEIIGENFRSIKSNASSMCNVKEIELTLAPEEETDYKRDHQEDVINENVDDSNTEEMIIEETITTYPGDANEVIIEENTETFEDNLVLECVTEEIVTESTEEVVSLENRDSRQISEDIGSIEIDSASINKESNSCDEAVQDIRESLVLEDTSQSISTNDSNDAEVQSIFSKEIESKDLNNSEDIPVTKTVDLLDSQSDMAVNSIEESDEALIKAPVECVDDNIPNSNIKEENMLISNSLNETEDDADLIELRNTLENDAPSAAENNSSKEDLACSHQLDNTDEQKMLKPSIISDKLADLHLQDQSIADDICQNVLELNLNIDQETENKKLESLYEKLENKKLAKKIPRRSRNADNKPTKTQKLVKSKLSKAVIKNTSKDTGNDDASSKIDKKKSKKNIQTPKTSKKPKDKTDKKEKLSDIELEDTEVRRSTRIKSISVMKKKTSGHGLVRSKSEPSLNESDISDNNSTQTESERGTPIPSPKATKEKKTKISKSAENISELSSAISMESKLENLSETKVNFNVKNETNAQDPIIEARLKGFVHLKENLYKTDRMTCKEAKRMTCDCFLTQDEISSDEYGCGEDCLNRLLLIECGNLCQVGDRCTNKRFQKSQFAPVEVFNTEKKGLGLRAAANIPYGEFILEYVGEVLDSDEFDKRAEVYSQVKNIHYYFMALRADAIIDATTKGNISRFINHSCDPNAETQKWTVNGELRIGFFSTRTILAGEEITFDYRFQRYGKEAQKCYCEAATCRGWLGEQPDEDSEDEDEDEEDEDAIEVQKISTAEIGAETLQPLLQVNKDIVKNIDEVEESAKTTELHIAQSSAQEKIEKIKEEPTVPYPASTNVIIKKKSPKKRKARIELLEEIDQLNEEIEMLLTTGLKNQAHTLKLCRLMVRAKEPQQRTKLLRVLRRGELPCRRLFLDYHGLRLMHGYMIDVQHLILNNKSYESLRLELLQTLAVLPIPNKTMLQDSKVLSTVKKWAINKDLSSPQDSDSNSPAHEQMDTSVKQEKTPFEIKDEEEGKHSEDQEEEIRFLAGKLVEEWKNLKEVFRIPKKERIEQMKEHEREANKKFMQSGYGADHDKDRKTDRYRNFSKSKNERDRKSMKSGDIGEKPSAEYIRLSKIERRKLFALQHELKEEERRLKQRELWRQHEMNCLLIGTDPRFTAPFDPNRGFQCIWNPQIGQWQNYPLPQNSFAPAQVPALPNLHVPPPHMPKSVPTYPYGAPMGVNTSIGGSIPHPGSTINSMLGGGLPQNLSGGMPGGMPPKIAAANIPPGMPQNTTGGVLSSHNIPVSLAHMQNVQTKTSLYIQDASPIQTILKEEDLSQVKFMGPIPPPAILPQKWKCAKDKYGRPYYYHIKLRKSQWEPPPLPEEQVDFSETESSSDTSSLSSDSSSDNADSDDDIDDTRLLREVRKQMEKSKVPLKFAILDPKKIEEEGTPIDDKQHTEMDIDKEGTPVLAEENGGRSSIDIRLKEQFHLLKEENIPRKKRRVGLCEERLISPRSEEDKLQCKEDRRRYKANKEKLKRQKELINQQTKSQLKEIEFKKSKEKRTKVSLKAKMKEMPDFNSEAARKIKETFRANMASTVVSSLNIYRKPDCKAGRITNTEDFKHLARKLTHFVMLKEMKHIARIEDLTCTDNVKVKAREYIKKYMSKFGEVYVKRNDSPDFKD